MSNFNAVLKHVEDEEYEHPYFMLRRLVRDPLIKTKEIAEQTGYSYQYVSRFRLSQKRREVIRKEQEEQDQRHFEKQVAAIVKAAVNEEREACALLVEGGIKTEPRLGIETAKRLAAAIRARG